MPPFFTTKSFLFFSLALLISVQSCGTDGSDAGDVLDNQFFEVYEAKSSEVEEFGESEDSEEIVQPDLSMKLPPGQVRAGKITKNIELIGGRTAKGEIGDFKIYNSKVAFIIQKADPSSGYKRFGGVPVDADVAREQGEPGQSQLGELFFGFSQRIFEPLSIEVINDGSDGERAVLKVSGKDALFSWLASFMSDILPMETINCDLTFEYSLGPDDEALQIDVALKSNNKESIEISFNEAAFIMGDGLKPYFEGIGFDEGKFTGFFNHWLALGDHVSYGLLADDGAINILGSYSNVTFGVYPSFSIEPGGIYHLRRHLIVAGGGISEVQRVIRKIKGIGNAGFLEGDVKAPGFAHERGIRIHVLKKDGSHFSVIKPDPEGYFYAELPPGDYDVTAKSDGFGPSAFSGVELKQGEKSTLSLELNGSVPFDYIVVEAGKGAVPAKIAFFRQGAQQTNIMPAMFREERYPMNAALVVFTHNGEGVAALPEGKYVAYASRGNEYEIAMKEIELFEPGQVAEFTLARSVETEGFLSGDFHIHAEHSPDSDISEEFRVRTALAENLELLVMTEHDTIRDLSSAVAALDSEENVKAITGSEITTYVYGHFNAFPLTEKPGELNYGGIDWFDTWAPELFEKMRKSEQHEIVIQVNHPRSPSIGGYFNSVGLDIEKGGIAEIMNWTDDFDAIEVFNGGCGNGNVQALFDWFDLLNRGYRFSVSGGSDSHSEFSPLGVPKVYIATDSAIEDFSPDEIVSNFKNQRVFVSCGPFALFSVNGAGPGELADYGDGLDIAVEIRAASWMKLKGFNIVRNGSIVFSMPYKDWNVQDDVVRFKDTIPLDAESDGWYLLEVKGSSGFYPVAGETPYAITNPVYVDYDGNGKFDPPLPQFK